MIGIEGVGIFRTPPLKVEAPDPVVVRDWKGTWEVLGVPVNPPHGILAAVMEVLEVNPVPEI